MPPFSKEKDLRCALYERIIRKGEKIAMFEKEKDWCKYAFEKKFITFSVRNSCRTRVSKEMSTYMDESGSEIQNNAKRDTTTQTELTDILRVS